MKKKLTLLSVILLFANQVLFAQDNTLLIIVDDWGVDKSSLYGVGTNPPATPHINSLRSNGVLFRNAYANPLCSPTRATVLTGRYGFRTGVGYANDGIGSSETTIPEGLTNHTTTGTTHACIGKWHLSGGTSLSHPNTVGGFSHYSGAIACCISDYFNWTKTVNGTQQSLTNRYATTENVNDAISWLNGNKTKQWFLQLAFNAGHTPLHKPPVALLPSDFDASTASRADLYDAMIEAMDKEIGRLLTYLKNNGLYAKTNIIVMGDNGTESTAVVAPFDPNKSKFTLFDGGTKIPLMISGPAVVTPNRNVTGLVNTVDLFATILQLHGTNVTTVVPSGTKIDSRSLMPYIKNTATGSIRTWAFSELFITGSPSYGYTGKAIRNAKYKYISYPNKSPKEHLYDLSVDKFETNNLLLSTLTTEQQTNYNQLKTQLNTLLGTTTTATAENISNNMQLTEFEASKEAGKTIIVYPTSSENGVYTIELPENLHEALVKVTTMLGTEVFTKKVTHQENKIELLTQQSGYYVVTVSTPTGTSSHKVYKP